VQVRAKQLDIAGVEEQMAKLDSMLKEARAQTDKVQKDYNTMSEKVCDQELESGRRWQQHQHSCRRTP
jgi:hypothetical protein